MSRFGASHTSSTRFGWRTSRDLPESDERACLHGTGRVCRSNCSLHAHASIFPHINSVIALPT